MYFNNNDVLFILLAKEAILRQIFYSLNLDLGSVRYKGLFTCLIRDLNLQNLDFLGT